jgi:hypothetical protein
VGFREVFIIRYFITVPDFNHFNGLIFVLKSESVVVFINLIIVPIKWIKFFFCSEVSYNERKDLLMWSEKRDIHKRMNFDWIGGGFESVGMRENEFMCTL